jgi:hypothetical protein
MADEKESGAEAKGEEAKGAEEGKKAAVVAAPAEDVTKLKQELAQLHKVKEEYDRLNGRYNKDPKFKEVFDKAWKGDFNFDTVHNEKKREESEEADPVAKLQQELKETREKLEKIDNVMAIDRVSGARSSINAKYDDHFEGLAKTEGYKPGTEAYELLYNNAVRYGLQLANKYGLVNDSGVPDPLLKFNPDLIKEAFDVAHDKFKKAGYDVRDHERKKYLEQKKNSHKKEEDKYAKYFDPKNLKTVSDRARAIETVLKLKMKEAGVDPDDFKMV